MESRKGEQFCFALRCFYSRSKRRCRFINADGERTRQSVHSGWQKGDRVNRPYLSGYRKRRYIERPAADENTRSTAAPPPDSPFLFTRSQTKVASYSAVGRPVKRRSRPFTRASRQATRRPTAVAELGISALPGRRQLRPFAEEPPPLLSSPTAFPGIMFCSSYFALVIKPYFVLRLSAWLFKTQYYFGRVSINHSFVDFRRPIAATTCRKAELIIRQVMKKTVPSFFLSALKSRSCEADILMATFRFSDAGKKRKLPRVRYFSVR